MVRILFDTMWWHPADGWAIAARGYARAMELAGVDVTLFPHPGKLDPIVEREVGRFACKGEPPRRDLYCYSTTLGGPDVIEPKLRDVAGHRLPPRAFYTTFERHQVAASTARALNRLNGTWVPTTCNAEVLKKAGVRDVVVIPHCFFDDDPLLNLCPQSEARVFYWFGRWEHRKAPHNLIRAFLRAFRPDEAELVLKLSPIPWLPDPVAENKVYPCPESVIDHELTDPSVYRYWTRSLAHIKIRIVRGQLSRQDCVRLHNYGDVYVSASRGEGFDLPAFEAKLAGRRVLTTDSGGPRDFLGEHDVIIPATGTVPAHPLYKWGDGATYIDYDLDRLIAGMQLMRKTSGLNAKRDWPRERFEASAVGAQIRKWAEERIASSRKEPE